MRSKTRWLVALVLSWSTPGCISKGDTQISSNNVQEEDEDEATDAGSNPNRPGSATPSAEPEPNFADEPAAEPVDEPADPEPADDDGIEPSPEPTPPDEPVSPEPNTASGGSGAEPEPQPGPGVMPTVDSGNEPQPEEETVVCGEGSGKPRVGTSELLTEGDLVDKAQFAFAGGPGEHFLAWVDDAPNSPALGWLSIDAAGPTAPAYVEFTDSTPSPAPYLAALYVSEEASYALAWKNGNAIQFDWFEGGRWAREAPSEFAGEFTLPYVSEDGIAMAYNGSDYGIVPLAQHPYLVLVSPTGTASVLSADSTWFTRQEARDVLVDDGGSFITIGRYHDGSVSQVAQLMTSYDASSATATTSVLPAESPLFPGFGINDGGPRGMELVWDGMAVGVIFGGDPRSAGLHYARVTMAGAVAFEKVVNMKNLTPLDAWFDAGAGITYVLSTDDGADLYLTGLDATNGDVVVENAVVAGAAGVTEGYLVWDESQERHRAFFSSLGDGGNLHQLSTTVIDCRTP